MNEFPHTVTFQKYERVPDGGGGYTENWIDFLTTEAHVQPISSNQYAQAQQLEKPIDHNIFYPYQEGVKGSMRAIWHDREEKKVVDGVEQMVKLTLSLRSNPLDQGGLGEVNMVKAQLNG